MMFGMGQQKYPQANLSVTFCQIFPFDFVQNINPVEMVCRVCFSYCLRQVGFLFGLFFGLKTGPTSSKTSVTFNELHGAVFQKTELSIEHSLEIYSSQFF
jgi:hypothetical protein